MPAPPPSFHAPAGESEHGLEGDPVLKAKLARLSPAARHQLETQLAARMNPPQSKRKKRRIALSNPSPQLNPPKVTGQGLKAVPNPVGQAREEKKRRFIDAFLKAHGIQ